MPSFVSGTPWPLDGWSLVFRDLANCDWQSCTKFIGLGSKHHFRYKTCHNKREIGEKEIFGVNLLDA